MKRGSTRQGQIPEPRREAKEVRTFRTFPSQTLVKTLRIVGRMEVVWCLSALSSQTRSSWTCCPAGIHQVLGSLLWLLQQPEDHWVAEVQASHGLLYGGGQRVWLQPDDCHQIVSTPVLCADFALSSKSLLPWLPGTYSPSCEAFRETIRKADAPKKKMFCNVWHKRYKLGNGASS